MEFNLSDSYLINTTFTKNILFAEQRPKKLLIFLNPVSGKGKSQSLYEKTVAPLFQLVDITTDVIGELVTYES